MTTATNSGLPYSLVGSGLTKTADVGGSRFGTWSYKAFAPTSYVQESLTTPINQLSIPPTYANLASYGMSANAPAASAVSAPIYSPNNPGFWVLLAVVFLGTMVVLKHKGKVK